MCWFIQVLNYSFFKVAVMWLCCAAAPSADESQYYTVI